MHEIIHIILRTILVLVIIFFLFKLLGKKQISQMNMFDYITGITIGSIVADISLDIEKNLFPSIPHNILSKPKKYSLKNFL